MQTMARFFMAVKNDSALVERLISLKANEDREGIIEIMRQYGVSDDDIKRGEAMEKALHTSEGGELDDTELDLVAGGKLTQLQQAHNVNDIDEIRNCYFMYIGVDKSLCLFAHQHTDFE